MICRRPPPHAKFILPAAFVFAFTTFAGDASATDVTAIRLDGTSIIGNLRQWDNEHILLATPTGVSLLGDRRSASRHQS